MRRSSNEARPTTNLTRPRTRSSNPVPSSGESVANSIWGKGGLPMRLPPGLLGASPARRGRGRAHLDRRLGCAEMRPRKDRQTKVDRRRATLPELKVTPAATYEHD